MAALVVRPALPPVVRSSPADLGTIAVLAAAALVVWLLVLPLELLLGA